MMHPQVAHSCALAPRISPHTLTRHPTLDTPTNPCRPFPLPGSFRDQMRAADARASSSMADQISLRQSPDFQSHTAKFEVGPGGYFAGAFLDCVCCKPLSHVHTLQHIGNCEVCCAGARNAV
jgi:hypothetical protein